MGKIVKNREPAVAYFRTSSAANVGEEKDSLKRQQSVVGAFATRLTPDQIQPLANELVEIKLQLILRQTLCLVLGIQWFDLNAGS
jgi:hypothetical protein